MSDKKLYDERDVEDNDDFHDLYMLHVNAMTTEDLHSKSAIAAELAYRDLQITELKKEILLMQMRQAYDYM